MAQVDVEVIVPFVHLPKVEREQGGLAALGTCNGDDIGLQAPIDRNLSKGAN